MATYRKKPVEIEARQFIGIPPDGTNADELVAWIRESGHEADMRIMADNDDAVRIYVLIYGAWVVAVLDDWLRISATEVLHPLKPDIFEAIYEPVEFA